MRHGWRWGGRNNVFGRELEKVSAANVNVRARRVEKVSAENLNILSARDVLRKFQLRT